MNEFIRVQALVGSDALEKLKNSNVAVFGIGGVGGFVAEALVRSGVGKITLIDNDTIDESNVNRQIIALTSNVGKAKVDVMKERLLLINKNLAVTTLKTFYLPENADQIDLSSFDYVVDAIDTVSAKIEIIIRAKEKGIPVISCMGTGGKLDPTKLRVGTIDKTKVCPLARVMRRELKKRNVFDVKVVWSEEEGVKSVLEQGENLVKADGKTAPPSMIFVPATAGLIIAEQVVIDLIKGEK
ncbi:MAG: tRNA threonylcarbamoyladenosine dehydratase [Clostridia bacterium]|nr:tRNA threonylcarbamoyladenosine dehydratase [Clostridia bacterium]